MDYIPISKVASIDDLTKEEILYLIEIAEDLRENSPLGSDRLGDRVVATLFFEPSTRTRLSFETAALRLGGKVISVADGRASSTQKGETLEDTLKTVEQYANIIVMRHPENGAAKRALRVLRKETVFINAGDGSNEHPTQTLADLYTIYLEKGRIDNLKIALVGDIKYSRAVRSLLKGLNNFDGIEVFIYAPEGIGYDNIAEEMAQYENIKYSVADSLASCIVPSDVIYVTRPQKERYEDATLFEKVKSKFTITPELLELSPNKPIVLHPLPRNEEISIEVDSMPHAKYFRQAGNGVFIREALLLYLTMGSIFI